MAKRIVLAGGGTGGHLFPLVTVADYLRQRQAELGDFEFLFLGPDNQMEREIMGKHKIPHKTVLSGKLRRYFSLSYFSDFFRMPIGFFQALWHLLIFMPDVVYAKGGYASVPVVIAARMYRIPVLIHESDAAPGLANRFLGGIASKVAICFDRAKMHFPPSRTIFTGMPIKEEVMGGDPKRARELLKLPENGKPVIFVIGGSQGAKPINDSLLEILEEVVARYQVIHQTGKDHYEEVCRKVEEKGFDLKAGDYRPIAFLGNEIGDVMALAEVVISRSGSTAIGEAAANKKPLILVPIGESANDHQRINAFILAKAGAAVVLEEDNFKRGLLLHNLNVILSDDDLRESMKKNISEFYYPQASELIATTLLALIK